jgi:hypothetical protein
MPSDLFYSEINSSDNSSKTSGPNVLPSCWWKFTKISNLKQNQKWQTIHGASIISKVDHNKRVWTKLAPSSLQPLDKPTSSAFIFHAGPSPSPYKPTFITCYIIFLCNFFLNGKLHLFIHNSNNNSTVTHSTQTHSNQGVLLTCIKYYRCFITHQITLCNAPKGSYNNNNNKRWLQEQ